MVMRKHLRAHDHILERAQHLLKRDLRQQAHDLAVLQLGRRRPHVPLESRQRVDSFRGAFEALVFLQPADELGARIVFRSVALQGRTREQHPRLDLRQCRGHHHVLASKLELQVLHQLDVLHVLLGDLGERNVENVEILPADEIQKQVERTFERLEEYFECLRRDIQIARHLRHGLAVDHGERHLDLLGRLRGRGSLRRRVRHDDFQFGLHERPRNGAFSPPEDALRGALRPASDARPRALSRRPP